jgi:glycosyltransferase involved in cell wall biosynthesis
MIVGVDGSNLRGGGGVTHLVNLLTAADPAAHGIHRIVVWGARPLLDKLPERGWLVKQPQRALERSAVRRLMWQRLSLPGLARRECDVLFAPGGSTPHGFRPSIALSQNLLPFAPGELRRYGATAIGVRLRLLRFAQARAIRSADGVIFLTRHARDTVLQAVPDCGASELIPHGVEDRFRSPPRPQRSIADDEPIRVLYVSIIDLYKHQDVVAQAVADLRREGLPLVADFVGPAYPPALRAFRAAADRLDPNGDFLHYHGAIAHADLPEWYRSADLFVFASSCETFGITLLEAMATGLPIACSDRSALPEVLGDAGEFFDPECAASIAGALRRLARDPALRRRHAEAAHARAQLFTWERCARDTLRFIARVGGGAARAT